MRTLSGALLLCLCSSVWQLDWEDSFDGPLNASNWNVVIQAESGNQIEVYTADNVYTTVVDGVSALVLRTHLANVTIDGKTFNVTSGRVDTSFKRNMTRGTRLEVRARLQNDAAYGIHTAHWLLGYGCWPLHNEIDVMECQSPGNLYAPERPGAGAYSWQVTTSTLHTGRACANETRNSASSVYPLSRPAFNFTQDWTTWSVEWNATDLAMFVNDTRVNHIYPGMPGWSGPWEIPNEDMFLILSQAYMAHRVKGDPPLWVWPVLQLIDSVRVYRWAA